MKKDNLVTLEDASVGVAYKVKDIQLEAPIMRRLQMLGLTEGTTIQVLGKKKKGPVIFKVRGTKYAIGKTVAEGILLGGGRDE